MKNYGEKEGGEGKMGIKKEGEEEGEGEGRKEKEWEGRYGSGGGKLTIEATSK